MVNANSIRVTANSFKKEIFTVIKTVKQYESLIDGNTFNMK